MRSGAPRQLALARDQSVAGYLGRLVAAELKRRGGRLFAEGEKGPREAGEAIAALAEVRTSIDELDAIAGRLARSATAHGASWDDVSSSLRLSPSEAESAFGSSDGQ